MSTNNKARGAIASNRAEKRIFMVLEPLRCIYVESEKALMGPMVDPRWRAVKVEEYLQRYAASANKSKELKSIKKEETDALVLEYLEFRIGANKKGAVPKKKAERSEREIAIEYAHACVSAVPSNFQASMMRAMAMADRTPEQIAGEFATEPINVSVFLKLFFDIQPMLPHDALLLGVVARAQTQAAGGDISPQEAQWIRLAYRSGWDVLQSVMLGRALTDPSGVLKRLDGQMMGQLAIRAREFTDARLTSSEPGTASDLRSYLEHKRLSMKAKVNEPEQDHDKAEEFQGNMNMAFVKRSEQMAQVLMQKIITDLKWVEAIADENLEAARWEQRRAHLANSPGEDYATETAEYEKACEVRATARLAIVKRLGFYLGQMRDAMASEGITPSESESRRASHWNQK